MFIKFRQMWKGLYFAETGDRQIQQETKQQGNLRISGPFGTKIWDDDGIVCVIKSSLIKGLAPSNSATIEVINALCSEEGQKLIISLSCDSPISKQELVEKTNMELSRLNLLLLLFTESKIIEYVGGNNASKSGYMIGGHCGIVAYMLLAAMHILNKKYYATSRYIRNE